MEKLSEAGDKSGRNQESKQARQKPQDFKFIRILITQHKVRGRAASHSVSYYQFPIKPSEFSVNIKHFELGHLL